MKSIRFVVWGFLKGSSWALMSASTFIASVAESLKDRNK